MLYDIAMDTSVDAMVTTTADTSSYVGSIQTLNDITMDTSVDDAIVTYQRQRPLLRMNRDTV